MLRFVLYPLTVQICGWVFGSGAAAMAAFDPEFRVLLEPIFDIEEVPAPSVPVPVVNNRCFIAKFPILRDLDGAVKVRKFRLWASTWCCEFRVLEDKTAGVTTLGGILVVAPAKMRTFQSMWLMNLRNWKVNSGVKNDRAKFRMLSLMEYHAELGPLPGEVSTFSIADQVRREAARVEGEKNNVIWAAASKMAREKREAEEADHARYHKLRKLYEGRRCLGDNLAGTFFFPREGVPGPSWSSAFLVHMGGGGAPRLACGAPGAGGPGLD